MKRQNFATNSKWEPIVGYSRAVRMGDMIFVTGTVAIDEQGEPVGVGDVYAQTKQVLANIARVLGRAGASMKDVVRTRTLSPTSRSGRPSGGRTRSTFATSGRRRRWSRSRS